jgi:hypothetical protein
MKNQNENRHEIEHSSNDRPVSIIQKLNMLKALEFRGIKIPKEGVSGQDLETMFYEVIRRGIMIPATNLNKTEIRNLATLFEGKTEGLKFNQGSGKFKNFSMKDLDLVIKNQESKMKNRKRI